ncbi:MAG: hypothetical protein ABR881_19730 [Candidatus Sulfotelmatobacter sp.]|jgi:hypothetical protein
MECETDSQSLTPIGKYKTEGLLNSLTPGWSQFALEALGGRVIVAAKPAKTQEAGVDQLVVVVEFENLEKAVAAFKRSSQLI